MIPRRLLPACLVLALTQAPGVATAEAQTRLLKRIETSHELYYLGLSQAEPLYILAAARLRKSVLLVPGTRAPEGGQSETGQPDLSVEAMLQAAAPMIAGDPALEALAEDIRAERDKGVSNGPVYSIVTIKGGGRDRYPSVRFTGGEYAEIYVEGAPGTDLNLLVHDAKNRLVCSDTDISAVAYCGWRPGTDTDYTITVVNEAGRGGRYSMMSN